VNTPCEPVEKLVIIFDMLSSSGILASLEKKGRTDAYLTILDEISEFFWKEIQKISPSLDKILRDDPAACCHKFTGDGWVLLFPSVLDGEPLNGEKVLKFMNQLSKRFDSRFEKRIRPILDQGVASIPKHIGLTFGVHFGTLSKMKILSREEYIGLSLCIASRLQKQAKKKFENTDPAFKAMVSKECADKFFAGVTRFSPTPHTVDIKIDSNFKSFEAISYSLERSASGCREMEKRREEIKKLLTKHRHG